MIKYIILSSETEKINKYDAIINKVMINHELDYKTYKFNEDNKSFDNLCETNNNETSIFIIKHDEFINAEEVIKKIKNNCQNYMTFIIVIDEYNKLKIDNILDNYPFMSKVIQTDEFIKLENDLKYILKLTYEDDKVLTFSYERIIYKVAFKDILYVEKELNGKRCMIVCKNNTYKTYNSIIQIKHLLDDRFIKTHQSALINLDNVTKVDLEASKIYFCNKVECNLLSRNMKKKVRNILLNK